MSAGLPYGLQAMLKVLLLLVPHACVEYAFDASSVLLLFSFSLSLSLNARRRVVFIVVVFIIIIIIFVCVLLVQSQQRLDDDVDEVSFARC